MIRQQLIPSKNSGLKLHYKFQTAVFSDNRLLTKHTFYCFTFVLLLFLFKIFDDLRNQLHGSINAENRAV